MATVLITQSYERDRLFWGWVGVFAVVAAAIVVPGFVTKYRNALKGIKYAEYVKNRDAS